MHKRYSIIIPVLNESRQINELIRHLQSLEHADESELIIVDGSASGETIAAITAACSTLRCLSSAPGRARQMNAGAAVAAGEILLFLHADTRLPADALTQISGALAKEHLIGGAFDLGILSPRWVYRLIAKAASLRSRLTRIPYGDQALFFRRDEFFRMGRYPEIPIMEDVALMRRVKKAGGRIHIIPRSVATSPRRWEREGICAGTLRNWLLLAAYSLGVSPDRLVRYYQAAEKYPSASFPSSSAIRRTEKYASWRRISEALHLGIFEQPAKNILSTTHHKPAADACILLFVKSPAHVSVKSRLAGAIGEETARELYRNFVLDILETLSRVTAESGAATIVCVHPPEAEREMRTWLGGDYRTLPQEGNNLGERMRNALLRSFADGYRRAVLIGSDAPDLTGKIILEGLACLENRNAVIGPAHDGGYYLIGFRSGALLPAVFDDIPWGTGEVFARTMQIFRQFSYDVPVLPPWRDIDTYDDLRHLRTTQRQGPFADSRTMRYLRLQGEVRKESDALAASTQRCARAPAQEDPAPAVQPKQ